jgi:hypothetical protein
MYFYAIYVYMYICVCACVLCPSDVIVLVCYRAEEGAMQRSGEIGEGIYIYIHIYTSTYPFDFQ